jgi:ubiquinone/menaquinone biosynthesis C-methylase UbiE
MPGWLKKSWRSCMMKFLMRYYSCGLIAPEALKDARVLDLGCGAGRDVYALSQMIGEEGFVVGVDMTD